MMRSARGVSSAPCSSVLLEVGAAHVLHDEDRLGPGGGVERDEPGEVGVGGQGEQGAGLLAEQRLELLLGEVPGGARGVVRDLEREQLAIGAHALLGAHAEQHRAPGAPADRPHDVEAAEQARQRDPAGQQALGGGRGRGVRLTMRPAGEPQQHALDRRGEGRGERAPGGIDRDRDRLLEHVALTADRVLDRAQRGLELGAVIDGGEAEPLLGPEHAARERGRARSRSRRSDPAGIVAWLPAAVIRASWLPIRHSASRTDSTRGDCSAGSASASSPRRSTTPRTASPSSGSAAAQVAWVRWA